MSEATSPRELSPLKNGEDEVISFTGSEGEYLVNFHREEKGSRIALISEKDLNLLYDKILHPMEHFNDHPSEEWQILQTAVGSIAKIYEPDIDESQDGTTTYVMEIVSNYSPTEDFNKFVIEPMAKIGLIPSNTPKLFE